MEEIAFTCQNCHFIFPAFEARACPRCDSKHVVKHLKHATGSVGVKAEESKGRPSALQQKGSTQRVFGDTKEAWKSFHASEIVSCLHCGGTRFSLDFKHKEKVCVNCGAVFSLRRKQV